MKGFIKSGLMIERDTQDYCPLLLHVFENHTLVASQEGFVSFLMSSQDAFQKLFCWEVENVDPLILHSYSYMKLYSLFFLPSIVL